jgi:hypothetical protein
METDMGLVARFHRTSVDDMAARDEDSAPGWSPRARTMTIIGAAVASWVVVIAIVYLIGEAVGG